LRANTNGVDDRHRRYAPLCASRRGQLAVPDHREVPATVAVRAGGHQFGDCGQRAQPLATPQHVDRHGRVIAQPGGGFVAVALGQVGDVCDDSTERAVVVALDQLDGAGGSRRVLDTGDALRRGTR